MIVPQEHKLYDAMRRKIKREDIIEKGMELIHLNGFNATGIKEITDAVDIPKGSFYNHFKNKEAFGVAVLKHYERGNLELLDEYLLDASHPPLARIHRFFERLTEHMSTYYAYRYGCLAGNFGSELGDINPTIGRATFETLERIRMRFDACLREAVAAGDLPPDTDTAEMAEFITNSWQGALVKMKPSHHAYPLEVFLKYLTEKILKP